MWSMKNSKNLVQVDLGFIHAFLASLSVIIVSELGDKTFFIAAILAMKNPRVTVFAGAMAALGLMTVLSGNYIFNCYRTNIKLIRRFVMSFSCSFFLQILYQSRNVPSP
jgi:putative Ca2+/H+ antiporter (TMEM165/GDT1 family)